MARNVNVFITNWHWTGSNVPTPQAQVNVDLEWADDEGQPHSWEGTVTFPNDLQQVPVAWVKEALEDLMLRAVRKRLGINES